MTVEKQIPLTDDQYDHLLRSHRGTKLIGKVLADAISQLAESIAIDDEFFWKSVSKLADAPAQRCTVDWINRCIVVKDEPSDADNIVPCKLA